MYVACPSCKAIYQIQAEHLHAARGQVRCGACRNTFSAFEAVFDDPAEALAYAEKQRAERDIEALVSKALEQVPRGEEAPEYHTEAGAAEHQPAVASERQPSQPEPVPGDSQAGHVPPPQHRQVEATPTGEETHLGGPEAAHLPEDTQDEGVQAPSSGAPSSVAEGADADRSETFAAETAVPVAEQAVAEDGGAAPRTARDTAATAAPASPAFLTDLDFQAQPPAVEFVPRGPEPAAPRSEVPTVLLLEHEYRDGVSNGAWGAIAAALLLIALLIGQYGYVERYRLAAVPQLRPVLEYGCQLLGCDLPLRRDVARVEILEREVRDHPQVDDALLIHVSFVNHADFTQPYPVFAVSFSDVSGTPIAARRFRPDEYLSDARHPDDGMKPGERAQLTLEVVDPSDRAVSFQFDFL